jgi:hypothetical protein
MCVTRETSDEMAVRFTNEIRETLATSRVIQYYEPFIINDKHTGFPTLDMILILMLNKSLFPIKPKPTVYGEEPHVYGKAMHIFMYLDENEHIFDLLPNYKIKKVVVTTVEDTARMNAANRWVFSLDYARQAAKDLRFIRKHSEANFRYALKASIEENKLKK